MSNSRYVIWLDELLMADVSTVRGKNASLGEMISQLTQAGLRVPGVFATIADAFRNFLAHGGMAQRIEQALATLGNRRCPGTGDDWRANSRLDRGNAVPVTA